jgi:flagellar hook-length control protein FliK
LDSPQKAGVNVQGKQAQAAMPQLLPDPAPIDRTGGVSGASAQAGFSTQNLHNAGLLTPGFGQALDSPQKAGVNVQGKQAQAAIPQVLPSFQDPSIAQSSAQSSGAGMTDGDRLPEVGTALETAGDEGFVQVPPETLAQMQALTAPEASMAQSNANSRSDVTRIPSFAATDEGQAVTRQKATAKGSSEKNPPERARLAVKTASDLTSYPAYGPTLKAPAEIPNGVSGQFGQPDAAGLPRTEAPARGDASVVEKGFAPVAPLESLVVPNPQTLGGTFSSSLHSPAPSSLLPNTVQTLHAQLPGVIEHLHHGAVRDGHSHAEVLLNPAELGRIRFDLITQGDQVQVTLSVERPETLDLLRTNAEALRQEFREVGLNADMLNFGEWAQRAPPRDQPQAPPDQVTSAAPPLAIPTPYVKPVHASGLDLRL